MTKPTSEGSSDPRGDEDDSSRKTTDKGRHSQAVIRKDPPSRSRPLKVNLAGLRPLTPSNRKDLQLSLAARGSIAGQERAALQAGYLLSALDFPLYESLSGLYPSEVSRVFPTPPAWWPMEIGNVPICLPKEFAMYRHVLLGTPEETCPEMVWRKMYHLLCDQLALGWVADYIEREPKYGLKRVSHLSAKMAKDVITHGSFYIITTKFPKIMGDFVKKHKNSLDFSDIPPQAEMVVNHRRFEVEYRGISISSCGESISEADSQVQKGRELWRKLDMDVNANINEEYSPAVASATAYGNGYIAWVHEKFIRSLAENSRIPEDVSTLIDDHLNTYDYKRDLQGFINWALKDSAKKR